MSDTSAFRSARAAAYRIEDEPHPGRFAHLVVQPFWPLIAVMLAGTWLSWPWFVVNAWAVGSPTRRREAAYAAGGFLVSALLAVGLLRGQESGALGAALPYAALVLTVWKLGVSYALYLLQSRSFQLYQHFGGEVRNGMPVAVLGFLLGRRLVFGALPELWRWVLG